MNVGGLLCGTSIESIESIKSIESIESVESSDSIESIESIQSVEPIESTVLVRADFRKLRVSISGSVISVQIWSFCDYFQASGPLQKVQARCKDQFGPILSFRVSRGFELWSLEDLANEN